jgi:hypothetical protein
MTRAIITETEREQLAGEHGEQRRCEAATRVRNRIQNELGDDIDVLRLHHPGLYEEYLSVSVPDYHDTDERDSRQNRIQRAVDALEGTPPDPSNPAVQNWADKVDVTPEEIADALGP